MGRLKKNDVKGKELVEKRMRICKKLGITYSAYMARLRNGWAEDEAAICPRVERAVRYYKGQSARSYVLEHGGKLSTFNYYCKICKDTEEIVQLTLNAKRVKYYRDGMSLMQWCKKNGKNYYTEYKKMMQKQTDK